MTIKRRLLISNILMVVVPITVTFIVTWLNLLGNNETFENAVTWWFFPIFTLLIGLVFVVSRVLSKFLFKDILTSLEVLSTGARKISAGDLDYTIEHSMSNEFDEVSQNFNEMAGRLSEMVKQRQADEQNRKELIAGISHDLRTPLTSIKIYLEGLKKGVATTPEMQEKYLTILEEKADGMAYIINQLFLFSQMDIGEFPLQMEMVDVGVELEKLAIGLCAEYEDRGLCLSLEENIHGGFVSLDLVQFRNVIENLLNNSLKYGKKENSQVRISCLKEQEKVIISVTDNGDGVPDEMLSQIFDVFYRGDASRNSAVKGSGLGLAISSKIIGRFGGTIHAENVASGGFRVVIALPAVKGVRV